MDEIFEQPIRLKNGQPVIRVHQAKWILKNINNQALFKRLGRQTQYEMKQKMFGVGVFGWFQTPGRSPDLSGIGQLHRYM
jgi:hypothetical protein